MNTRTPCIEHISICLLHFNSSINTTDRSVVLTHFHYSRDTLHSTVQSPLHYSLFPLFSLTPSSRYQWHNSKSQVLNQFDSTITQEDDNPMLVILLSLLHVLLSPNHTQPHFHYDTRYYLVSNHYSHIQLRILPMKNMRRRERRKERKELKENRFLL